MTTARAASWAFGAALAIATATGTRSGFAYCPSYTPAGTATGTKCGIDPAPGANPTSAEWNAIFTKVAGGKAAWGADGPDIAKLNAGCLKPKPVVPVDARFPCHVLKALAMQESSWMQFCVPDTPASSIGAPSQTIVSFDCGYGVGQVTSGMHLGEAPAFDRARVAAEPTYNLATGTRILRDKWAATYCVGDGDPDLVEDWYSALWAYNGLSYSNNPNNPNLKANRGPYNPKNGGAYAYQERVLGWMEFPPSAAHWSSLAVAYPNRGAMGDTRGPPELDEPSCASPTSCVATRATHTSTCDGVVTIGGDPDGGDAEDGGAGFTLPSGPIALPTLRHDGGGVAGASAAGPEEPANAAVAADDGGCGCRTAGSRSRDAGGGVGGLAIGLALLAARRGRHHGGVRRRERERRG